ncbi:MAG: ATP-binding protein [Lachnospiraceae bacterium]|nr:ATP-binding protein [Lachnospiraceae bacterium]
MGFFNPDMEDMLDIFQTESFELMDTMESYLMAEEEKNQLSAEVLQGIFRIVHTMKSSAAMMGLESMSRCTHRLEDLFLIYRDTPEKTEGMEKTIFNLLYEYVDYIRSEMNEIVNEDYTPAEADDLLMEINRILEKAQQEENDSKRTDGIQADKLISPKPEIEKSKNETPENAFVSSEATPEKMYQWKVFLKENCQMENARAFLLMKQMKPYCGQLFTIPEDLQAEAAASQIQKNGFVIYFTTNEIETVRQKISSSIYVKQIEDIGEILKKEEKEGQQKEKKKKSDSQAETVSNKLGMVSWHKIIQLQNVTGELIVLANMLEREAEGHQYSEEIREMLLKNRQILKDLEDVVNNLSMTPVSGMVHQYNRAIRDICKKEDKEIVLQVQGEDLEIDKTLIDSMNNPILHLIRNAADHGIESKEKRETAGKPVKGTILFSVFSSGENLFFSVSDDGRGLDREQILDKAEKSGLLDRPRTSYTEDQAFQIIFKPGFSTSGKVTEFSGRGVGLDVVRKAADRLHGSVYVESSLGEGTTITVSVPISLTSIDCIQFSLDGHICFVPVKDVEQIYNYAQSQIQILKMDGKEYFRDETMIPLIRLKKAYGLLKPKKTGDNQEIDTLTGNEIIMVVKGIKHKMAFVIDQIEGQYTIVEKNLPELIPRDYKKQTGINGCAVAADGSIGFILNADWIMRAYERGDLYE